MLFQPVICKFVVEYIGIIVVPLTVIAVVTVLWLNVFDSVQWVFYVCAYYSEEEKKN